MSNMITERTPLVIAAEINMIKEQTEKVVLNNAVEVGRRLKEAKEIRNAIPLSQDNCKERLGLWKLKF
ncbi:DUF3102 domain-containing protein [Desulfosporosinus fructosivorans]|uniref:DUF3102 domain-containing protein n=1 Tax=Desulfosporosinus fructosivorans TaxID=2018669 RepID=A0A4Z0R6F4_9FIRM|nr:DUF3102 domain-containing protein [Desulfosporosinus fructosivorans]